MNTQSKHENLVQLAEEMEQHDYFNKMEKKEQLEEKMLNTFKVPCKAVMCLKVRQFYLCSFFGIRLINFGSSISMNAACLLFALSTVQI